jgi:2-oxo-4-hydroxy-4-carboxy--5-ureidoimidazoline (OHCU) decarboxylase
MPLPRLALILSFATLVAAAHADTKPVVPPQEQPARKVRAPDARDEAAKNHPELKEQIEKIKAMSPEERRTFFKEHPELREKLMDRTQATSPAADKRADFLKDHPELKEQIEKLRAMTPEERQAWMKEHPELREKLMQRAQNSEVTPKKREDFLKDHPELKEQIEKLKAMTPEERQAWVKEHPELAKKIMPAMRAGAGNATPAPKDKLREKSNDIFERLSPEDREKLEKRRTEQK